MKKYLALTLVASSLALSACGHSVKQNALPLLQSVETGLSAAQDFERANHTALGLDTVAPDADRKLCPDSVLVDATHPAGQPLPIGATRHQVISCIFAQAFTSQKASSVALQNLPPNSPAPTVFVALQADVDAIFGIAKGLSNNANQQAWLAAVQAVVNNVISVAATLKGN